MNMRGLRKFVTTFAGLAATIAAFAPSALAQGCVMCYTSASAAGRRGERALDAAILVLLVPVLLLFLGILIFAFRRASSATLATQREWPACPDEVGERVEGSVHQPVLRLSFFTRPH
jgi:hypothetical protein